MTLRASLLFVAGFTTIFVVLGIGATAFGAALLRNQEAVVRWFGVVIIVLGLSTMGLLRIPILLRERRVDMAQVPRGPAWAFPMGMAFAAGWAPCIGPVLATILTAAAVSGTVVWGAVLLALYSLGLGIPFVLLALGFTRAQTSMAWLSRNGRRIEITGGLLLVAVGVLFVTGEWQPLFRPLQRWFAGARMAPDLTVEPAPRRTAPWIGLALAVGVLSLVAVLATGTPARSRATESPLIGRQVPMVAATTIDGDDFDLASMRGRFVLLNFFATWCTPCREEHPALVAFEKRHRPVGDARVVGIIFDDDVDAIRQFREDEGGTWPMLEDPDGSLAVSFGVARVPESFLIAPNGTVVSRLVGGVREADLERLLAEARGGDVDGEAQ